MDNRRILIAAATLSIAIVPVICTAAEDSASKDRPEPFSAVVPFDLPKRPTSPHTEKKPAPPPHDTQAYSDETKRNHARLEGILRVNYLGDPDHIVFEGNSRFTERELRWALTCDLKYQAAARPSNDIGEYLGTLEERLTLGYLNSGCPDVKVHARRDEKRNAIVVHIDEGTRYRKGEIRVRRSKLISEAGLNKFLTEPQPSPRWSYIFGNGEPDAGTKDEQQKKTPSHDVASDSSDDESTVYWKVGEPIDFREPDRLKTKGPNLEKGVGLALTDLGFGHSRYHIDLERDEKKGIVYPYVTILHEAPPAVLGDIQITGLKRDTKKSLLEYLNVKPGAPINSKTLRQVDAQLNDSCRYWMHKIEVVYPEADRYGSNTAGPKTTLRLTVEEFQPAPKLGEPLPPTDETMRKCAAWLNSLADGFAGCDLVCTIAAADLAGTAGHSQIVLAADGTLAIDARLTSLGFWRLNHSLISCPDSIELYDWKSADKFCLSSPLQPHCKIQILASHNANGEQETRGFFGYASSPADKSARTSVFSDVRIDPVAMLHIAHKPTTRTALRDGVLTLTDDAGEIQIDDATGAIRSLKAASFLGVGISAVDIRAEKGVARKLADKIRTRGAAFQNRYSKAEPYASTISYALEQVQRQLGVRDEPTLRAVYKLATAVAADKEVRQVFAVPSRDSPDSKADPFTIPGAPEFSAETWRRCAWYYTPLVADKLFPRGSLAWVILREAAFDEDNLSHKLTYSSEKEIDRLIDNNDLGPISQLCLFHIIRLIDTNNSAHLTRRGADIALRNLSDDGLLKDMQFLTDGDRGLAAASRAIANNCNALPEEELDALQQLMPATAADVFERLVARRKKHADEPPADSIRAAMLDAWHNGLKDRVEADLRSIRTCVATADEKKSPAK